ncbi:hypothetical protein FOXB_01726 [Fusarium oxysporum f. sp. conglutinans Fo5176]|uniref:Uncharacterized protein n=1 Tax=Fusarium oxysporum (strain Fo5176) TaxID=660025 RepID=F9F5Q1_FUSOF|nr:hypothetical protein FOXB_01726 [Fusarium oxysporum f. sp. conglutinans Fo5176]KAG6999925.1 E3 ubiquitin-protein ligase mib1 [Fusarium oxysporum f. sp. conglutinans]KAI8417008.1 hypothetical protein FOFC_03321 [Fusarium oxysporum]
MISDSQEHPPKRVKATHDDPLFSQAEANTINLGLTPLYEAASNGDNERIKELLQSPDANINQPCFGKTALEASIISRFRKESTALLLIDSGAQLDFKDGSNALCAASYYGLKEVVQAAIGKGLDINKPFHGKHPILCAVKGGHADMVDHLLQQGVKISDFEVHPSQEGEFVTEDSKNPFSAAWYQQRYDIFLLLLDATLAHECRERRWEYSELLPQLDESDPRERLAERLAIWLKSRPLGSVNPKTDYKGPDMVILRTLELVFGMGMRLRGDSILVGLLIEKNAPLPAFVLYFLERHWHGMNASPYNMFMSLHCRPAILEIIFTALPLIQQSNKEGCWLSRVANALVEEGLPLIYDSLEQKLGHQCSLMQKTIPF